MAFFKETGLLLEIKKFECEVNMTLERWIYCMVFAYERTLEIASISVRSKASSISLDV